MEKVNVLGCLLLNLYVNWKYESCLLMLVIIDGI